MKSVILSEEAIFIKNEKKISSQFVRTGNLSQGSICTKLICTYVWLVRHRSKQTHKEIERERKRERERGQESDGLYGNKNVCLSFIYHYH